MVLHFYFLFLINNNGTSQVIDEAFHEETCRQKFVLEERLLKREAILRMKEERVKYHDNLMMTVSSSMKQTINRLIRFDYISNI